MHFKKCFFFDRNENKLLSEFLKIIVHKLIIGQIWWNTDLQFIHICIIYFPIKFVVALSYNNITGLENFGKTKWLKVKKVTDFKQLTCKTSSQSFRYYIPLNKEL